MDVERRNMACTTHLRDLTAEYWDTSHIYRYSPFRELKPSKLDVPIKFVIRHSSSSSYRSYKKTRYILRLGDFSQSP